MHRLPRSRTPVRVHGLRLVNLRHLEKQRKHSVRKIFPRDCVRIDVGRQGESDGPYPQTDAVLVRGQFNASLGRRALCTRRGGVKQGGAGPGGEFGGARHDQRRGAGLGIGLQLRGHVAYVDALGYRHPYRVVGGQVLHVDIRGEGLVVGREAGVDCARDLERATTGCRFRVEVGDLWLRWCSRLRRL